MDEDKKPVVTSVTSSIRNEISDATAKRIKPSQSVVIIQRPKIKIVKR